MYRWIHIAAFTLLYVTARFPFADDSFFPFALQLLILPIYCYRRWITHVTLHYPTLPTQVPTHIAPTCLPTGSQFRTHCLPHVVAIRSPFPNLRLDRTAHCPPRLPPRWLDYITTTLPPNALLRFNAHPGILASAVGCLPCLTFQFAHTPHGPLQPHYRVAPGALDYAFTLPDGGYITIPRYPHLLPTPHCGSSLVCVCWLPHSFVTGSCVWLQFPLRSVYVLVGLVLTQFTVTRFIYLVYVGGSWTVVPHLPLPHLPLPVLPI